MLYLITGGNGTFKTALTIKHVFDKSGRESRPVCWNGRFVMVEGGPLSVWRKIDAKDWWDQPDGTIFFFDEAHNDFPVRPNSASVPDHVRRLAEHRARGFDFYLITQHPQNIDGFIRKLIANPGYHQHHKRQAGTDLVSVIRWDAVNPNCERPASGNTGQVSMVAAPKEVYPWYRSATLHTAKVTVPKSVYVLALCAVAVPALIYYAYRSVTGGIAAKAPVSQAKPGTAAPFGQPVPTGNSLTAGQGGRPAAAPPLTPAEYIAMRQPRVDGLAFTAPAYDQVTQPTVAPYPAACVERTAAGKCECFSQQGTKLHVPMEVCTQIVRNGFFVDWQLQEGRAGNGKAPAERPAQVDRPAQVERGPGPIAGSSGKASSVPAMLSAPGDTAPVFFPAVVADYVQPLTDRERQDAGVWSGIKRGDWGK